jgi:SSS family solute:Na+ symporter
VILATLSMQFTLVDWGIVVAFLVFTTVLGAMLSGKQATMRDFFLGGRKLPWYAVSGSIIATEISAVTFIGVPYVVFKPGGNFTYLQLGLLGSLLARIIVGYVLVPQYYRKEIYSPYDYMGNQLGQRVRTMTSGLFVFGAMLAQGARVYLTCQIIIVLLGDQIHVLSSRFGLNELAWAAIIIGVISIGWALVGGIATVIWTNLALFLTFLIGALVALGVIAHELPGGLAEVFRVGWAAKDSGAWGKFTFFDFDPSPAKDFTIWTAVIASTWGGLFSYGTDQMLVQGMFCCRDEREARKAIIGSACGQVVTMTVMLVGVGLYAYYQAHPLAGEALEVFQKKGDRIFPIFICQVVPLGLKGVIMAAALAAAISTVMGVLTALSQTVMGAFYAPLRRRQLLGRLGSVDRLEVVLDSDAEHRRNLQISRGLVVWWGVVLCVLAYLTDEVAHREPSILQLALAVAGYAGGALLGCFALAFLPFKVDGRGYMWSAPLAVGYVYALAWHNDASHRACVVFAALLFAGWLVYALVRPRQVSDAGPHVLPVPAQALALLVGLAGMLAVNWYGEWNAAGPGEPAKMVSIAWPWYAPLGSVVAVIWGYLLARRKLDGAPGGPVVAMANAR